MKRKLAIVTAIVAFLGVPYLCFLLGAATYKALMVDTATDECSQTVNFTGTLKVGGETLAAANVTQIGNAVKIYNVSVDPTDIGDGKTLVYDSGSGTLKYDTAGGGTLAGTVGTTDNAIARADGTGGSTVQGSTVTIDDSGSVNIPSGQAYKIDGTALAATDVGAEPADAGIQGHISSTSNPHSVTKAQVGLTNVPDTDCTNASNLSSGTLDGDRLPALSETKKGGVPATGTPSGKYLKDDGTWASPSGSGDVTGPSGGTTSTMLAGYADATGKVLQATALYSNEVVSAASPSQGDVLYYDGSTWAKLTAGDSGKFLKTQGAGANPIWDSPSGSGDVTGPSGGTTSTMLAGFADATGKALQATGVYSNEIVSIASPVNGDVLYYNGGWQTLAKGDDGQYLKLASGVPSWADGGAVGSSGLTMATNKLLGRGTASTGAIEEITLGTNLSFTGTTLNAAGGSGSGYGLSTDPATLVLADDDKIAVAELSVSFSNATIDAYASNLQGYWRFEDSGLDATTNANDITWFNSPSYSSSGKNNKAIDLERGSSQYGKISHVAGLLPSSKFTFSGWFKFEDVDVEHILLRSYGTSQANINLELYQKKMYLSIWQSNGVDKQALGTTELSAGVWYHLAFVADGSNLQCYLNGSTDGSSTAYDGTIRTQSGGYLWIGCDQNVQNCMDGLGDEYGFWNTNLSSSAISAIYNSGTGRFYAQSSVYSLSTTKISDLVALQSYKTMYVDAGAMVSKVTSGAAAGTKEYATNDINMDCYAFDGATDEGVQFKLMMPDDWDGGTVKVKFAWSSATGSTAGDTCCFAVRGGAISNDDAIDTALGTAVAVTDTLLADNGTDIQVSAASGAITIAGTPALGDMVVFEVYRDVSEDDMTEDAWLFGVQIQYRTKTTAIAAW